MDKELFRKFKIKMPHEWLSERLILSEMTQKRFANMLGIDPSQLNRILKGKELISQHLLGYSCRIFGLNDHETELIIARANVFYAYHELDKQTDRICKSHHKEGIAGLLIRVQSILTDVAQSLHVQNSTIEEKRRLERLRGFLLDAELLIRIITRTFLGEDNVFLCPENAYFHLRQPLSSYVGAIITDGKSSKNKELSFLSEIILRDLRSTSKLKYVTGGKNSYAQQHAAHMLCRYGGDEDRNLARSYLDVDDVLAQRMAFFGLSLGENIDYEINHQLLKNIKNDRSFLESVIFFDAAHYGDASFTEGASSDNPLRLDVTISNSLSYILNDMKTENIDLNFVKLTAYIKKYGDGIISNHHRVSIKEILRFLGDSSEISNERLDFQSIFQKTIN